MSRTARSAAFHAWLLWPTTIFLIAISMRKSANPDARIAVMNKFIQGVPSIPIRYATLPLRRSFVMLAVRASIARVKAGQDDGLPAVLYRRLRAGEHPIRVWRAHRKLSLNPVPERASVARAYLSEIETGKKPGSVAALQRIARILRVEIDDLVAADRAEANRSRNLRRL